MTGTGTLCRGDVDYLSFPVTADRRYRVTVSFPDGGAAGNTIDILDGDGVQQDAATFSSFQIERTISAITDVTETDTVHYLRLTGAGMDADSWSYTVSIEDYPAPADIDCSDEFMAGIEPNDTLTGAYELTAPGTFTFVRCDDDDVDAYHFTLPASSGVEVTVLFDNDEGDLALRLLNDDNEASSIDYSDAAGADIEVVGAAAGNTDLWLRVALWSPAAMGTNDQTYTVTVTPLP